MCVYVVAVYVVRPNVIHVDHRWFVIDAAEFNAQFPLGSVIQPNELPSTGAPWPNYLRDDNGQFVVGEQLDMYMIYLLFEPFISITSSFRDSTHCCCQQRIHCEHTAHRIPQHVLQRTVLTVVQALSVALVMFVANSLVPACTLLALWC